MFFLGSALLLLGHLGDGGGRAPFVEGDALVGGGTDVGLWLGEDGAWQRACEEASGGAPIGYFRTEAGSVLASTVNGLIVTDDGGCAWRPVDGLLRNFEVSDIEAARTAPHTVFLTTSRAGAPNALWRSSDGGTTFVETSLAGVIHPLFDVALSDDGAVVAVTGFDLDEETPLVRTSTDDGASFVAPSGAALPLLSATRVRALDVDDRVWLATLDNAGDAALIHASHALDDLVPVQDFPGDVLALVRHGPDRFALARPSTLYRQAGGVGPFVPLEGVALSCLARAGDGSALWGCGTPGSGVQFLRSDDGVAWSVALADEELGERACPDGTPAATLCSALPDDAGVVMEDAGGLGDDAGTAPPDAGAPDAGAPDAGREGTDPSDPKRSPDADEPAGGCAQGRTSVEPWMAVAVLLLSRLARASARRRARPSRPRAP